MITRIEYEATMTTQRPGPVCGVLRKSPPPSRDCEREGC
jgi:hypothetical protein